MSVQVAIGNASYRQALRDLLVRSGNWEVLLVDEPDPAREGVIVLDSEHLRRLPRPLPCPECIVLVARNDPAQMSKAWAAGIHSVVSEKDPLSTTLLAIMSAGLRSPAHARRN